MMLGRFVAITLDQTRQVVLEAKTKLSSDIDPQGGKRERRRTARTVRDLVNQFNDERIAVHIKASTERADFAGCL